jgi:hypothetical protein
MTGGFFGGKVVDWIKYAEFPFDINRPAAVSYAVELGGFVNIIPGKGFFNFLACMGFL